MALNVLGTPLQTCSTDPLTGFYRDGCCSTGGDDAGVHVVCARVTAEFLEFSKAAGNDLSTPRPEFGFAGLKPADQWCLCASRWAEAFEAGMAPPSYSLRRTCEPSNGARWTISVPTPSTDAHRIGAGKS